MAESRRTKHKQRLGIITTVLLVILLIYLAVQIFGKMRTSLSVISTQTVTDKSFLSLNGYVYRDEEIITVENNEIADFLVRDGEKIPVGKEYMTLYKTNIASVGDRYALQSEINGLSERISLLSDGLDGGIRVQDVGSVKAALDMSYYSYLSSLASGSFSSAEYDGEGILDALGKQQMISGRLDSIKVSADAIVNEKAELIGKHATDSGRNVRSNRSCYISLNVDGYESAFAYGDVMSMTADEFRASIADLQRSGIDNGVAKRVYGSKWYLVVPASGVVLASFSAGSSYDVYLSEIGGDSIPMTAERIEMSGSGESGFVVLSSGEIGKSFEISRYTGIKIERSEVSGFRVPDRAIHSLDTDGDGYTDHTGVYVMSGNYVKFRRIDVVSYGTGYVIVRMTDSAEGEQQFPYLSSNELIIDSGGDLYDGKLIK